MPAEADGIFSYDPLEAKADPHRNRAASTVILLEVEERGTSVIEPDAIRDAEERMIEGIGQLQPVLKLEALVDPEGLEDAQVNILVAIAQEGIGAQGCRTVCRTSLPRRPR